VNDEQKRMAIGAFGNAELNLVNDRPWVAAVHPLNFPAPAASSSSSSPTGHKSRDVFTRDCLGSRCWRGPRIIRDS